MKSPLPIWTTLCFGCVSAAAVEQQLGPSLPRYDLGRPVAQFEMPGRLDEISGMAATTDGRLFGHNDERATVHEIDPLTGAVGKRFSLGDPPIEGDFEGLAIAGDRFFLITSGGRLYEFREAADRTTTPHRETDSGLGGSCEAEGLEYDPLDEALLIACKTSTPERGTIVIGRLPLDPSRPRLAPIEIARAQLAAFDLSPNFEASAVALSPYGTLYLASAPREALIEVERGGRVIAGVRISRDRHPQSEGLAFGADSTLYIADEQNDAEVARVTRYGRASPAGDSR